jgi:membrane fusion protein (multidrug efflux system)
MQFRSSVPTAGMLASVLSAASLLLLNGCSKPSLPPPPGPAAVEVIPAVEREVPLTGEWVATTDGYVNAQIQPQVSGYLIRQDYKEGGEVRKDQVLFEIDPRPFQAVLDQAKGALAQAQAQLGLAEINTKRDTPLAQAHAIAQSQLDTDIQTEAANKALVATAQAQVEAADLNVGFTKVRSLIDGIAGQAQVQVGNLVGTSSVLTSVSQLNPIKVYFSISEQEYLGLSARVKAGGHGDLLNSGDAIPLKLTLANGQVYPYTGHIIFVDRSVSAQTGSLRIAAGFANPNNLLRPGQFGRVTAETEVLHKAVLIPQRAINELQGIYQVIAVGADNVAHVRSVKLGTQVGTDIVIQDGVQPGERVITEGLDKVRDGMKVAPQLDTALATTTPAGQNAQGN